MTKQEFETLIGEEINENFFNTTITSVYNFHPIISEVNGKKQMAEIWAIGKKGLITSMLPIALEMQTLENEMIELRNKIERKKNEIAEVKAAFK